MNVSRTIKNTVLQSNKAIDLIQKVERKYGFNSGIKYVLALPDLPIIGDGGRYIPKSYSFLGSTIKVPLNSDNQTFKEYVYHEMGHAVFENYNLRGFLTPFVKKYQKESEYNDASMRASEYMRLPSFVSGYARCNREEDFCETYSSYLLNEKTWHKEVYYSGDTINVKKDKKLKMKLESIHELLNALGNF
jgi:hypothetical protein